MLRTIRFQSVNPVGLKMDFSFAAVCLFVLIASLPQACTAAEQRLIQIHGSDTMLILNKEFASVYGKEHPAVTFNVSGGGSGVGIGELLEGNVDIAAASRAMKRSEKKMFLDRTGAEPKEYIVALDGIGIYVHNNNPVNRLTIPQLKGILSGSIRNWSQVGGLNQQIDIYNRDKFSGTRAFMKDHILVDEDFYDEAVEVSSTSMVTACVARNQRAIGYGGIAYSQGAHIIRLADDPMSNGVWPSHENIASGKYSLSRPLYFYVNPKSMDDTVTNFVDWVKGPEGQTVVTFVGYHPAPGPDAEKLFQEAQKKLAVNQGPIILTPVNSKDYGFDFVVILQDDGEGLQSDQVGLTVQFSEGCDSIKNVKKLSLRIGSDIELPVDLKQDNSLKINLKKNLIEQATVYLAESDAISDGNDYTIRLIDYCPKN